MKSLPLPHHQRDTIVFWNTLLTSFGRQPYFVEHDSSLRLLFLILESELLNAKQILQQGDKRYSKWSHWTFHQLRPPNGLKDNLPMVSQKRGRGTALSNYYLIRDFVLQVHRDSVCGIGAALRWAEWGLRSVSCSGNGRARGRLGGEAAREAAAATKRRLLLRRTSCPCCHWPWDWEGCPWGWRTWSRRARSPASRGSVPLPGCTPGSGEEGHAAGRYARRACGTHVSLGADRARASSRLPGNVCRHCTAPSSPGPTLEGKAVRVTGGNAKENQGKSRECLGPRCKQTQRTQRKMPNEEIGLPSFLTQKRGVENKVTAASGWNRWEGNWASKGSRSFSSVFTPQKVKGRPVRASRKVKLAQLTTRRFLQAKLQTQTQSASPTLSLPLQSLSTC